MPLHAFSTASYTIPLPPGHRFPIEKYALLRQRVISEGLVPSDRLHSPDRASPEQLQLVHTADYVDRFTGGRLTEIEIRRVGFPWSPELSERSYRAVGGTIGASRAALEHGISINLAGGTHHAFADHGEGFCVFNDVAVSIRVLQHEGRIRRAAIIDLDVHQGNGTHAIFSGDRSVFTFSMHGGRNYPFNKVAGSLDLELPDATGSDTYLELLAEHLPDVLVRAAPDLVVYLAGADPHERDRLGRLKMTHEGLMRRDVMVIAACREAGIPVAITIAGGYGHDIMETVEVHANTVRIARDFA